MKKLILLALVLLASGCATAQQSSVGWVKEGAPTEQLKKDYQECRGPLYVKPGMSIEQYEKDHQFCEEAEWARSKRAQSWRLWSSTVSEIISTTAVGLCERCMKSKGYEKNSPKSEDDINKCMEEKGYQWK